VGVGKMFVDYIADTGFPGSGFSWHGQVGALWNQRRFPKKKLHFGRSEVDGLVYDERKTRIKMEIPA
jgi:hypothetical protein